MGLLSYLASVENKRNIKKLEVIADKIELLADKYEAMSDEELRQQTEVLKGRLTEYETLDDILPDAFAVVREASTRVLGMRHFYVQLMGGICLHQGRIAEMRTGEGKTLVATLPAYLNALAGKGVHIVTVNEYLATFQSEWMGKLFNFLGLSVGITLSQMPEELKKHAYECDITYCTNSELGFDYLRDNMVVYLKDKVQRGLHYAIIDEIDSILIDEARTPLIISGRPIKASEMCQRANYFVKGLHKDLHFTIDEEKKAITLTPDGTIEAERRFDIDNLSDSENSELNHYINNALRANFIMKRDIDYIVEKAEIILIDEFTGRKMIGRRFSKGLHQALEVKESLPIKNENRTVGTITYQNLFRLYKKLSGMTGTAKTEEREFNQIYNLDVVEIPTNLPMIRDDENDVIFAKASGKMKAIVADIADCYEHGQPVLVGTVSIERSEELSKKLKQRGIPHNVLNAKNHLVEAEIVAQAGKKGSVTIATNMAGRGTDILLGGNPDFMARKKLRELKVEEDVISDAVTLNATTDEEVLRVRELYNQYFKEFTKKTRKEKKEVLELGGLRIIGTERHESRRIDNQLRGRAGRQGDPGSSVFYISLEDDLPRIFGTDKYANAIDRLMDDESRPISRMGLFSKRIENCQKRVEGTNYTARRSVLQYDEVMNEQRKIIYEERDSVLEGKNMREQVLNMMMETIDETVDAYCDATVDWDEWDVKGLNKELHRLLLPKEKEYLTEERLNEWRIPDIKENLYEHVVQEYNDKIKVFEQNGIDFNEEERSWLLRFIDRLWMDHIDAMDELRKSVGLRGYGNQDPILTYKKEGLEMFEELTRNIRELAVSNLVRMYFVEKQKPLVREPLISITALGQGNIVNKLKQTGKVTKLVVEPERNKPCPCGSGKKYKLCCGKRQ